MGPSWGPAATMELLLPERVRLPRLYTEALCGHREASTPRAWNKACDGRTLISYTIVLCPVDRATGARAVPEWDWCPGWTSNVTPKEGKIVVQGLSTACDPGFESQLRCFQPRSLLTHLRSERWAEHGATLHETQLEHRAPGSGWVQPWPLTPLGARTGEYSVVLRGQCVPGLDQAG